MNDFEKQFEQIVSAFDINDQPNAEHKKTLRQQMLTAHKESPSKKTAPRIQPIWSRIMKSNITKSAAAAIIVIASLFFFNTTNSSLYAQVIKAMRKAQTIHATGYRLYDEKMFKSSEIWYRQNTGYKMFSRHKKNPAYTIIDNGQYSWKHREGQDFAVRSNSITTENLPKELTETHRYLEKCTKDKDRIEIIDGVPCQLYGSPQTLMM